LFSPNSSTFSQSPPTRFRCQGPRERRSLPGERWSRPAAPFPGLHRLQEGRILRTAVCCRSTNNRFLLPTTHRRREATLSLSGENSNTAALSWGLVSIPPPAQRLSPCRATPEKDQPFSGSLVSEPVLCMEVSQYSNWYRATSCINSGKRRLIYILFYYIII